MWIPTNDHVPGIRKNEKESNFYCSRSITPKRVTIGRVHLRDLAPGQHCSEETRSGGDPLATMCPI